MCSVNRALRGLEVKMNSYWVCSTVHRVLRGLEVTSSNEGKPSFVHRALRGLEAQKSNTLKGKLTTTGAAFPLSDGSKAFVALGGFTLPADLEALVPSETLRPFHPNLSLTHLGLDFRPQSADPLF